MILSIQIAKFNFHQYDESCFTKFNACQTYLLYGITKSVLQSHLTLCINHVGSDTQQYHHYKHNKILHFCINYNMECYTAKKSTII